MVEKTIDIGGVVETFRCTGRTPRVYRNLRDRDMLLDMQTFSDARAESDETGEEVSAADLDRFYDIAYVMAYHAAMAGDRLKEFPATTDDWLEKFNMFDLMSAVEEIFDLWTSSNKTTVEPKNVSSAVEPNEKSQQHSSN